MVLVLVCQDDLTLLSVERSVKLDAAFLIYGATELEADQLRSLYMTMQIYLPSESAHTAPRIYNQR